ncbi:hypothetical protein CYLTODRAFT_373369 [Cylindrobasidium torrendii FP15055 ss-10]|uniref:AAA+ ATPase domain-containing protein n=1 Tax=Cylindrobasidium torrendii FP15055 ss-10 TaxID=1314674 RepID=A0A0D7BHJ0_9AGAR|nr:hypothetical protein CYLTODRAFT_373369 [Cylindrobasidium torrendii FP15055 ss-10]
MVDTTNVQTLLDQLRLCPLGTDVPESTLQTIYQHLMDVSKDNNIHWFCAKASATTFEAAAFALRLHAYENRDGILKWREKLGVCLSGCAQCVHGLEKSKAVARATYMSVFPKEMQTVFFDSFEEYETKTVLQNLAKAGINLDSTSSQKTLANAPMPDAYHMLSSFGVFKDSRIQDLLDRFAPSTVLSWPLDAIPAGILLLLLHRNPRVRKWATKQIAVTSAVPIPSAAFYEPYCDVLQVLAAAFSSPQVLDSKSTTILSFSDLTSGVAWPALETTLKYIPPDYLTSGRQTVDLRRIIVSRLRDNGHEFSAILKCFVALLNYIGPNVWQGEAAEFPSAVFDSIKENSAFIDVLAGGTGETSHLSWFKLYLSHIKDMDIHLRVLLQMVGFLLEDLRHERLNKCRPRFIGFVVSLLEWEENEKHQDIVSNVFKTHGESLMSVAFSCEPMEGEWEDARARIRELIRLALSRDVKSVLRSVIAMGVAVAKGSEKDIATLVGPAPTVRKDIWDTVYRTLRTNNGDDIHLVVSVVSEVAHLDNLNDRAFKKILAIPSTKAIYQTTKDGLVTIRNGLLGAVSAYAASNSANDANELLQRHPIMVKHLIQLLLSPVANFQSAARAFFGSAFDAYVRVDCFRALFENHTAITFSSLFEYLADFQYFAPRVPEATSLSKVLVRSFVDVLNILCRQDALLFNLEFVKPSEPSSPALHLPKLWTLMSQALTHIFRYTPVWAPHNDNEGMVEWMRDAILFGTGMMDDLPSFRSAAESATTISSDKASRIGSDMLNDMQQMIPDLAKWLRLTNEELLHQSFTFLDRLFQLCRDNKLKPHEDGLGRLKRYLTEADNEKERTRLNSAKLQQLRDIVAMFDDRSGDVEIVEEAVVDSSKLPQPIEISDDDEVQIIEQRVGVDTKLKAKLQSQKDKEAKRREKAKEQERAAEKVKRAKQKDDSRAAKPPDVKGKSSKSKSRPVDPPIKQVFNKQTTTFFDSNDKAKLDRLQTAQTAKFKRTQPVAGTSRSTPATTDTNSDSSSSSSDEEDARSAAIKLGAGVSSKTKKPPPPRRTIQTIDPVTMRTYNSEISSREKEQMLRERRIREANFRATRRRDPDLHNLYRTLLTWNFDHNENWPPGAPIRTNKVPERFQDFQQYLKTFEPLLFHELWTQLLASKDTVAQAYSAQINTKTTSNVGTELSLVIQDQISDGWFLGDNDVVLLRHKVDRSKSTLARVKSSQKGRNGEGLNAVIQCYFDEYKPDPGIQLNSTWNLSKVFSLSTVLREYMALVSLQFYEYRDIVLRPHLKMSPPIEAEAIQTTMSLYKLNEPQARAVESALATDEFVLIQGPPGTGKTSTITGLVAAATARRPIPIRRPQEAVKPMAKVLICAPSNAAIDEITFRLKEGYRGSVKTDKPLNVVRVGTSIGDNVRDVSLNYLVDQKLGGEVNDGKESEAQLVTKFSEKNSLHEQLRQIGERLNAATSADDRKAADVERNRIRQRLRVLGDEIDKLKEAKTATYRRNDEVRRRAVREVLFEAEVICTTLSAAGHPMITLQALEFDTIIIDEAAQAIELSTLIPLQNPCQRCVLVGDPNQLPPTVTSKEATDKFYNQSLFVRLQKTNRNAVHLLSIQYRMHPEISLLPSKLFYDGELKDGPDMAVKTQAAWHADSKFGVYKVFSVSGNEEQAPGKSMKNVEEAEMVLALYRRLRRTYGTAIKVGVIAPYRGQVVQLRNIFLRAFGDDVTDTLVFNTVDGFQGQEKDIIILSTVRGGPGVKSIGFLSDVRRMNVALTRAKSSVFIVGNVATLERSNDMWKRIVQDARSRALVVTTTRTYFTEPSSFAAPVLPVPTAQPSAPMSASQRRQTSSTLAAPPPMDLQTPKALMSRTASGIKRKLSASDMDVDMPAASPVAPPAAASSSSHPPIPQPNPPAARPPPAKKPKKKGADMFIPKKRTNNGGGGPGDKRQRM